MTRVLGQVLELSYATFTEKSMDKPVDDWTAPSPNLVAMATRVGHTTFCMVPLNRPYPKNPLIGANICGYRRFCANLGEQNLGLNQKSKKTVL